MKVHDLVKILFTHDLDTPVVFPSDGVAWKTMTDKHIRKEGTYLVIDDKRASAGWSDIARLSGIVDTLKAQLTGCDVERSNEISLVFKKDLEVRDSEIKQLRGENRRLHAKVDGRKFVIQQLAAESRRLLKENEHCAVPFEHWTEVLATEAKIAKLEETVVELSDENNRLRGKNQLRNNLLRIRVDAQEYNLKVRLAKIKELEDKVQSAEDENDRLQQAYGAQERDLKIAVLEIGKLQDNVHIVMDENDRLRDESVRVLEDNLKLKGDVRASGSMLAAKALEVGILQNKIEYLQGNFEIMDKVVASHVAKIKQLKKSSWHWQTVVANLKDKIRVMDAAMANQGAEINRHWRTVVANLECALEQQYTGNNQDRTVRVELAKKVEDLQANATVMDTLAVENVVTIKRLKKDNAELWETIENLKANLLVMNEAAARHVATISIQGNRITVLSAEMNDLKANRAGIINQQEGRIGRQRAEITKLLNMVAELKKENDTAYRAPLVKQLRLDNRNLYQRLDNQKKTIESFFATDEQQKAEIRGLQNQVREGYEATLALMEENEKLEKQIKLLTKRWNQ